MADLIKQIMTPGGIALIVLFLILFDIGGIGTKVSNLLSKPSVTAPGTPSAPCLHDGATMTIGPMKVKWDPTGTVPAHYARVFVAGIDQGYKADGASMEVSPGSNVVVFYGENASTAAPTTLPFVYTARQEFLAPCASDFTTGDPSLDNEAYLLYNTTQEDQTNISGTFLCKSHDDGTENTGTAPEDIEWGDNYNVDCRVQGIHRKAFSPYGSPMMCVEYNASSWDVIEVLDSAGNKMPAKSAPTFLTLSETANTFNCFEFPSIFSSETIDFKLHLDVEDTGTNFAAPNYNNNISLFLLDQDWYQDTLTGKMDFGYENNVATNLGALDGAAIYTYAIAGPD